MIIEERGNMYDSQSRETIGVEDPRARQAA